MNSIIENDRNGCSSVFDPELNPATAAADRLKFFPEWKFERVQLLSERDEDFHTMFNENEDPYRYDVQILEYEKLTRDTFDMNSLSRISDSISRKHGQSTHISHAATLHRSSPTRKTAKGRHSIDKKRRPLVTSIACRSRLCQLGSSPHVTCGCSTIPSNKCSE